MNDSVFTERQPQWLVAAIDQRLAFMREQGAFELARVADNPMVVTFLTEPEDEADLIRWENACDHCNTYEPTGIGGGAVKREVEDLTVVINYGACKACAALP